MEPDDGHDDEAPEYRQPPSPDDRLWRHPSEVVPPAGPALPRQRPVWLIGALSAVVGGVLVTGVAAATGVFDDHATRRSEMATAAEVTMAPTVLAAARRARASTVVVEVTTANSTTRGFGLVFRSGGYVLTNAHLVEGARSVHAWARGAKASPAQLIGIDREFDVAVLKAARITAPTAVLGSAGELRPGQMLVAVAPVPASAKHRVAWATVCTVTAVHQPVRMTPDRLLLNMIETDAPGTTASTGAALLDNTGAVIGIRNAAATRATGRRAGIVTPIDVARVTAEQLVGGAVHKPWLGIEGTDVDPAIAGELDIKGGAMIGKVLPDSPASASGFKERDVVVAVDGQPIDTMSMLVVVLHLHRPGDTVTIDVVRGKDHQAVKVTLGERR